MIGPDRVRLLLVEDNELDRRSLVRQLTRLTDVRFDVVVASTLAEALATSEREHFDCVLLDLTLPDSTGLASVDAVLARPDTGPVIVLTGLEDPAVALEAVQRGAQDYLTKHRLDPELIERSVRYAITRHRNESELRTTQELLNVMHDRERIARDLHDTVIQHLFATGMGLQALANRTSESTTRTRLTAAAAEIDDAIKQLREAIFGLHTTSEISVVDELAQVAEANTAALGFRPTIRVVPGVDRIDAAIRHELVATVTEALSNVARHADATAAQVIVDLDGDEITAHVVDNGRGFDAEIGSSIGRLNGQGLRNMERRAAELSGGLTVGPGPGGGTRLTWRARLGPNPR